MANLEHQFSSGKDYYAVLGVLPGATRKEIQKAFRELSKQFHPDVCHGDNGEKFKEINEAWEVLGDIDNREQYNAWCKHSLRDAFVGSSTPKPKPKPPTSEHSHRKAQTDSEKSSEYPPSISKIMNSSEFRPRWCELTNLISQNQIAAEEIVPVLNYIFYAVKSWMQSNYDATHPKYESTQRVSNNFSNFLERLLKTGYLDGEQVTIEGNSDDVNRLIADCCEFAKNYRCPISVTRSPNTITIVFGQYKPSMTAFYYGSANRSDKPDGLPDWKSDENSYREALISETGIYHILKAQQNLFNRLQFLRESSPNRKYKPGLVDAFSIWLINNNLPELTPEISDSVLREIQSVDLLIKNSVLTISNGSVGIYLDYQLNQLIEEITERFSLLSTLISRSPSIPLEVKSYLSQIGYFSLIQKACVESLKREFSEYSVLFNPKTDLSDLDGVFDRLNAAEIPIRFSQKESKDWNAIKYLFSTIRNPVTPATTVSLSTTLSQCRALPEFVPLRQLFLFYYLRQSNQLSDYLKFARLAWPLRWGYRILSQFSKGLDSMNLNTSSSFVTFCNSRQDT